MRLELGFIRAVCLLLAAAFCFGCQPDGGDLMPVSENAGAKTASFHFKNNVALQYDADKFSLKVLGDWKSTYGDITLTVVLLNKSSEKLIIDFDKMSIENTLGENLTLVKAAKLNSEQANKADNAFEVNQSETQTFNLQIGEKQRKYKDGVQYRGSEIGFKIPVVTKQNKLSQPTDYYFKFKYDSYQPEGDKDTGLIN